VSWPDIHTLVPHADPMVLLDRVIAADEESLTTQLTITEDSLFLDEKGVGSWIGIEYMAQTIAAYAGYQSSLKGEPVRIGFLLGARRYETSCSYFPLGSVLQIHARRVLQNENGLGALGAFECQICDINSVQLANATVTVFQPEKNHE
jgi:predicted hotdog family 3-hydroxylacyl-ACP dehydratase